MSLRAEVLHSVRWLAAGRFMAQLAAWVITPIVIRILTPSDYGLMALALVMIGFAELFRELGLYSAIVQRRDLPQRQIEQAFGILIVGNSLVYVLLFLSAPAVAAFFGDPRLTLMIRILGVQFPLAAVGVVQDAILSRRMAFKPKSFVNLAAALTNGFVTLGCAVSGFGVWALVFGSLSGAVVRPAGLIIAARKWYWPRFSWSGMGEMAGFGGFVTASRILWYLYTRADIVIIGKLLGHEVLGFYEVAMRLASMPMQKISGLLKQVSLAAYSSEQHDMEVFRWHYLKVLRVVSFCAFPVFFGLSSVAPELVTVVLGAQWTPAILPLQVLSLVMPLRMISGVNEPSIEALGKPGINTGNVAIACLFLPPAFLVGALYGGVLGVCLAWLALFPVLLLIMLKRTLPWVGISMRAYLGAMAKPGLGAALMYAVVIGVRETLTEPFLGPIVGLVTLIAAGMLSYAGIMGLLCRKDCREVIALARP